MHTSTNSPVRGRFWRGAEIARWRVDEVTGGDVWSLQKTLKVDVSHREVLEATLATPRLAGLL